MKSVKWFYVGAMAIALGMLTFATVACHDDDDDPKPAEGEVIETPKPVVEYYIMGTVTSGGEAMNGVKVKVGSKNYTTDSNGKFSVTESATGTYSIEASSNGYLSQKTSVVIAENAENRSVVTVALALTKESRKETVSVTAEEEIKVEDNSESNTTIEDPGEVAPEAVAEDKPLVKVELAIPAGAIDTEASASLISDGNVGISVTTFVPAPAEVTTEVKAEEVNQNVEKSIPLAAAKFEPSGLKFKNDVTISIPNPIPGITFADADMILTYQNPDTGEWGDAKDNDGNVILDNTVSEPTQVISEQNAWLLIDCMKDVVTGAGGTSSAAKISNMTTAGKSGTTSENRDVWFVGMSPYYTAGIWVGYDNNGYKHELSSKAGETSFHKKLWSKVMSRVHQGLENKDFTKPSGIVQATICTKSGKLAIPGVCDSDGRSGIVVNEYFAEGTQPTETCDKHVLVNICADTGLLATSMCPNQIVQSKVLLPAMQNGVAEAVTLDTAYGISANLQAATCTVHSGGVYVPSLYEQAGAAAGAVTPTDPNAVTDPAADPNAAAAADPAAGDGTAGSAGAGE